jgi:hypothetical protein
MDRIRNEGLYKNKSKKGRWGKNHKDNRNWPEYNEQLVVRGEFYLDFDFVDSWKKELEKMNEGKIGAPFLFPDSFMKWQAIWHQLIDYRGLEGIARKLSKFGLIPEYDDYTTIWYRIHKMKPEITLPDYDDLEVGSDGSGLKSNNAGQYRVFKYGERTRKKYLVVVITADVKHKLLDVDAHIEGEGDDEPKVAMKHVRGIERKGKKVKEFYGDGKFDNNDTFAELDKRKIEAKIPVHINANVRSSKHARRKAIREQFGLPVIAGARHFWDSRKKRRKMQSKWRKTVKHGMRWPITEGIFSAVKRKYGENVVSRKTSNMIAEAIQRFWAYDTICNYAIQKM